MEIVIIGGNPAGLSAASAIRRLHPDWTIDVYEKGEYISYGACGIPYYVSDEIHDINSLITLTKEQMENKRKIPIHLNHELIDVDFSSKKVEIQGDTTFKRTYDYLVIATGGHARSFPELDLDHSRIFYVHTLNHAKQLKTVIKNPNNNIKSVVVIGAGYIGLEMLEAYKAMNIGDIKIIGPRLVFRSNTQKYILDELTKHGVNAIIGKRVKNLEYLSEKQLRIILDDETSYVTDLLQISIGVSPATEVFKNKGLKMLTNGAIITNELMQTNIPDVYAAGDCIASYHQILDKNVYIPLAPAANKQGRLAGSVIAGKNVDPYPGVVGTSIFKVFDLYCAKTGISLDEALKLGYDAESIIIDNIEKAHYMGSKKMSLLLVFDTKSHRLLGAEITAPSTLGAKKIDTLATALSAKMRIEDIQALDLAYAPPFSPVWDPILIAANVARRKCK
ncbi:MAG: FAD-dependent oxidoreductase [Candidatus Hodarchaeales archaeon]|jgi:NADPH-dependent 2,4-dienoyl-CoA reductase/sulfur reductase-like enzyme